MADSPVPIQAPPFRMEASPAHMADRAWSTGAVLSESEACRPLILRDLRSLSPTACCTRVPASDAWGRSRRRPAGHPRIQCAVVCPIVRHMVTVAAITGTIAGATGAGIATAFGSTVFTCGADIRYGRDGAGAIPTFRTPGTIRATTIRSRGRITRQGSLGIPSTLPVLMTVASRIRQNRSSRPGLTRALRSLRLNLRPHPLSLLPRLRSRWYSKTGGLTSRFITTS